MRYTVVLMVLAVAMPTKRIQMSNIVTRIDYNQDEFQDDLFNFSDFIFDIFYYFIMKQKAKLKACNANDFIHSFIQRNQYFSFLHFYFSINFTLDISH